MANVTRQIVKIDEDKCDGCGECVPACAEGAIQIIHGKAVLVSDNLCDGLGACLGTCPQDAITIEERPAVSFDEEAVALRVAAPPRPIFQMHEQAGGCPGTALRQLEPAPAGPKASGASQKSMLGQWPVQLTLLPVAGNLWQDADVLIAADCVPVAMADFHSRLLVGKTLAIACPKLDDVRPYIEKLAAIFAHNTIRSVMVAMMEVPCCDGILQVLVEAMQKSGKAIPITALTVGINGEVLETRVVAVSAA